jgi:hypothetical protein
VDLIQKKAFFMKKLLCEPWWEGDFNKFGFKIDFNLLPIFCQNAGECASTPQNCFLKKNKLTTCACSQINNIQIKV